MKKVSHLYVFERIFLVGLKITMFEFPCLKYEIDGIAVELTPSP